MPSRFCRAPISAWRRARIGDKISRVFEVRSPEIFSPADCSSDFPRFHACEARCYRDSNRQEGALTAFSRGSACKMAHVLVTENYRVLDGPRFRRVLDCSLVLSDRTDEQDAALCHVRAAQPCQARRPLTAVSLCNAPTARERAGVSSRLFGRKMPLSAADYRRHFDD